MKALGLPALGLAALIALAATPALAADDVRVDCKNAITQLDMNQCSYQDYQRADAALNASYRTALAGQDRDGAALLRSAQRAWLSYRDAQCTYEAAPNTGGSIYPLVYNGCLTSLTQERTKLLEHGQR